MTDSKTTETHEEVKVERMEEPTQRPYYSPLVDIYEEDDKLVLVADMPGVSADGLEVTFEDGVLTLNGRSEGQRLTGVHQLYQEYVPGDYHRCFRIGEEIDVDGITAKMREGVLTVTLPKSERARRRRIEVK